MRSLCLSLLLSAVATLAGCTITPNQPYFAGSFSKGDPSKRYACELVIPAELAQVETVSRSYMIGLANKVRVPTGRFVRTTLESVMADYYSEVAICQKPSKPRPNVDRYELFMAVGQITSSTLDYQVRIGLICNGRKEDLSAYGRGSGGLFWSGIFGARTTLSNSTRQCMQSLGDQVAGIVAKRQAGGD